MADTIRVLIADDDAFLVESLRGVLVLSDLADFTVESIRDAGQVLPRIRAWRPDVIVLDDKFGEIPVGIDELLPAIRGEFEVVGVVIIKANRGHETEPISRSMTWGADGFLDKPIEPDKFCRAVIDSFKKAKAREEKYA